MAPHSTGRFWSLDYVSTTPKQLPEGADRGRGHLGFTPGVHTSRRSSFSVFFRASAVISVLTQCSRSTQTPAGLNLAYTYLVTFNEI